MAEVGGLLASAVLSMAGKKLGSIIKEQANMQWNFTGDMENMMETLKTLEATLEKRSINEKEVQLWLKRLKNAGLDIYDMFDDFHDTMTQPTRKMPGILSCLPIAYESFILANKMKNMRERLRKIEELHNTYNFTRGNSASTDQLQNDPRETTSDVNEGDIVGRDGEKQAIIDQLSARDINKETIILPIYGLGGMGKTTLASLVFNDNKFKEYDHRVWVYVSQVFDLKKIGRSIISLLSKQGSQQSTETMESINRCLDNLLSGMKILIVLDDIWEEKDSELEKLKRMLRVGKKGSMIDVIVTTREEVIARKISNIEPYKLQPLKEQMCWNIIKKISDFGSRDDKEQLREIGLDIAKKCGGVALAAQALGYMLKFKDLIGWSEVKDSGIWNESINDEVLPSLKLSYKSMPRHLRLCFVYCAIFPKGRNIVKDDLIHQWIALDLIKPSTRDGEEYIKQLLGMSFLQHSKLSSTSQQRAVFTMHDLVHDLARSVMDDELLVSYSNKGSNSCEQKYCRYALLTNYSGPTKLSAICPAQVRALHFLDCSELELRNDAFSFAKCLRVLDLSRCLLSKLPECVTQLSRLQYLNLHGSRGISALQESIGKIERLIHLDLSSCRMLVELPESLGNLKSLLHLELSGCSRVVAMPKSFCGLTKLQYLNLSNCSNLEKLPEAIGSLTELQHLNLSDCCKIGVLPESFQKLHNLVNLDLSSCGMLVELPESLGNLKSLLHLELSDCSRVVAMPKSFCGLTKLQYLNLSNCSNLEKLPEAIGSLTELQHLNLSDCCKIGVLPESFQKLHNLVHLDLSSCGMLVELPESLGNLKSLLHLELSDCSRVVAMPKSFCGLTKLQYLNLSNCSNLEKLPEAIGSLTELQHLNLSGCWKIGVLPESFQKLHNLVHVDLSRCRMLVELPESLGNLKSLVHLELSGCSRVVAMPKSFCGPTELQYLNFSYCSNLEKLPEAIGSLTKLQGLNFSNCSNLEKLPEAIGSLTELQYLNFSNCSNLEMLPEAIGSLTKLQYLDFSNCSNLEKLPEAIGSLTELQYLNCSNCSNLKKLPEGIESITKLQYLNFSNCSNLEKLPEAIGSLTELQYLNFSNCSDLEMLPEAIGSLTKLQNLDFSNCSNLEKLPEGIESLTKLQYLDFSNCSNLEKLPEALESLTELQYLNFSNCSNLEKLPESWLMSISCHLPNLVNLKLENLPRCSHLPPLGQLPNLEELHLEGLNSITKIDGDFCGARGAFRRLSTFRLQRMERLEEWSTTYSGEDGVEEFMFPKLETLRTENCRSLRLKPCAPIFSTWYISSSDKVISSWGEGGHISVPSSTTATMLWVGNSKVPKDKWRLLHHIPTLQRLELHCCYYLESLPESMRHLTYLRLLELSHCAKISVLPEWMSDLTSLESLEIDNCRSMKFLPQCVQQLTMLKKLKISGNYELKKWCESDENKMKIAHIEDVSYSGCDSVGDSSSKNDSVSLTLFMSFDVSTCGNLHQLEDVNLKALRMSCLEDVRFLEEARKIKLFDRQGLSRLTLEWTSDDDRILEDEDVLGELVPPGGLQHLKLHGYSSISFPIWFMGISQHLPNLVEIQLENLPRCNNLPPLGQLPNLEKLHLTRLRSITTIDGDFCGGKGAFGRLTTFMLDDMEKLEAWNTTYCGEDGMEEFMFPKLDRLYIGKCPKLRLTPRAPIFCSWTIQKSDKVISSWSEGDHVSHSPSDTPGTRLVVGCSEVPEGEWRLLDHLPKLQELVISNCDKLTSLPENMQHLTSLKTLEIWSCRRIKSLPQCIQQIKLLNVYNPKLKKWCESEENKMKLAHIEA